MNNNNNNGISSKESDLAPELCAMDALVEEAPPPLQVDTEMGGSAVTERKRWALQRSISSPNVRSLSLGDAAGLSSAEKRRNKLGYHRTAVACGRYNLREILRPPALTKQ